MEAAETDSPMVAIVVISYNTLEMTQACLQSVFEHAGGASIEVWVVDNASSDGSPSMVAEQFPHVRLIRNSENKGFAAANNQALRETGARYALLLNSDTLVLGDVIARSLRFLEDNPEIGAMGCRVLNEDRTMQRTCSQEPSLLNLLLLTSGLWRLDWPRWFGRYQMRHWQRDDERDVPVVSGCYLMVRRQAMEQVGLLDESFFFFGEETDWCRRFRAAGWRVVFAPVGEIVHYGSASAWKLGSRRDLLLTSGLVRFHRKHNGLAAAMAAMTILLVFNGMRAVFWSAMALVRPQDTVRARRDHFLGVVRGIPGAWPRLGTPAS